MASVQCDLRRRVLYVLHRGLVEARLLALSHKDQQLFDLADALEPLPGYLDDWHDEHLESIRFNMQTYQDKYPGESFDYVSHLEQYDPPDRF